MRKGYSMRIAVVLALVLLGCAGIEDPVSGFGEPLYERNENWGPCVEQGACWRHTAVYPPGYVVINSTDPVSFAVSSSDLEALFSLLGPLLEKDCDTPEVVDYRSVTTIRLAEEKTIVFPGCENSLRSVQELIESWRITAQTEGRLVQ